MAYRFALRVIAGGLLLGSITSASSAGLELELQYRSNFCINPSGAFNVPCNAFVNSATPDMNDNGTITAKFGVLPEANTGQGIWIGDETGGEFIYVSPFDTFLSDPTINNDGDAAFEQFFSSISMDGLYLYDSATGMTVRNTQPLGAAGWESPTINENGEVGMRIDFNSGDAYGSYNGSNATDIHVADNGADAGSPYSFLFTPAFNNNRQIAGKVRIGPGQGNERPDQIRIFNVDGSSTLIAQDIDGDPLSMFTGFDNSVALNDLGQVAFIAGLPGGGRGVFISDGKIITTIATEDDAEISDIEFFRPDLNNSGAVTFRAFDGSTPALRAVWIGNGDVLRRIATEHDIVPTDQGDGRIDQHDSSPTFGGSAAINERCQVAFHATLTPVNNNQEEWGTGLYVSTFVGDLNCDLVVNLFDLLDLLAAWGTNGAGADLAEPSDTVNVFDLLELLANWGS